MNRSRAPQEDSLRIPKLFVEYGLPFDFDPNGQVDRETAAWCIGMVPAFEALWESRGRELLFPVVKRFNRGFKRQELSVYIVAHKATIAMSHPLIVNVRRRIPKDFSREIETPKSFIGTLFHEMTHRYIMDHAHISSMSSPLIDKYRNESDTTRFHIHVMALLTLGFRATGRENDLKKMIEIEKTIPDPGYARSREIERKEGTENVLTDLEKLFSDELSRPQVSSS